MLRKPIFEENNMNYLNEQTLKSVVIKNEEEKLEKDDLKKLVELANYDFKKEIKNSEVQTKPTNTDDAPKNIFSNINFTNLFTPIIYPCNFLIPKLNLNLIKDDIQFTQKKRGRKTEKIETSTPHNKFADDNLRKKSKHILLTEVQNFLNSKLKEIYSDDIGKGILLKQLLTLNHKEKSNIIVDDNKLFLNKTLQEIFSDNISKKYTNFPLNHNKNLINRLLNEEDEEKRKYFNKLFNLTFIDALHHFQGKSIIKELSGLKTYKEVIKKYEDDKDYYENLSYHLTNFEEIINSKKSRKSRKKKEEEAKKIMQEYNSLFKSKELENPKND